MADFIQSEIRLIHEYQQPNPTDAQNEEGEVVSPTKDGETKKTKKMLGRGAVSRRSFGILFDVAQHITTKNFNDLSFQRTLIGDTRGAKLIANSRQNFNAQIELVRFGTMIGLTTIILKNPYVALVGVAARAIKIGLDYDNYKQQKQQYDALREKSIYESIHKRNRLAFNTYNRRA